MSAHVLCQALNHTTAQRDVDGSAYPRAGCFTSPRTPPAGAARAAAASPLLANTAEILFYFVSAQVGARLYFPRRSDAGNKIEFDSRLLSEFNSRERYIFRAFKIGIKVIASLNAASAGLRAGQHQQPRSATPRYNVGVKLPPARRAGAGRLIVL
ncbi:hypothetical protein EVAR_10065_1 [Eumeta japonica]|uniref:Uncharacterized protein n=1 Tax=Eumeta variegata TaxID=151549 RepID=A0A4C1TR85_EUMVA|nr:hypothetical protein EVAR_10065_1 [Eumeta japonica]